MKCTNCESEIKWGVKFCNECGAKIIYGETSTDGMKTQLAYKPDDLREHYVNLSDYKIKGIVLYVSNLVALTILVLLWVFAPVIEPNDYEEYVERLYSKYGSAANMMDISYSLPEMVETFVDYIKENATVDNGDAGFLTLISLVAIASIIVMVISIISTFRVLLKRQEDSIIDCKVYSIISVVMSVVLFIYVIAYNKYVESISISRAYEIKLSFMGYVIPSLSLIYYFTVVKMSIEHQEKMELTIQDDEF